MKFLVACLTFSVLILLSSCSLFKMSQVHDQMAAQLETTPYPYKIGVLHSKLMASLTSGKIFGKMVSLSNPNAAGDMARQQSIKEEMEEGFFYKDQVYTSTLNIDFSFFTKDTEVLKNKIFKAPVHSLENNPESFLIVKGNTIFEGTKDKVNPDSSLLRVYRLTKYNRPVNINIDWWKVLTGKGFNLGFSKGPIDLASSRQFQERDALEELRTFFEIDPERANKIESDLTATI